MADLWEDEGFGSGGAAPGGEGGGDWGEGEETSETELENGFDDPDELDDEDWAEGDE
jgi:hypothetical protein